MKQFIKINKNVKDLNDSEAYVYMLLVLCKTRKQVIHRGYLQTCLNVTNLDYISQILKSLESKGFIRRPEIRKGDGKRLVYDIIEPKNWFKLAIDVAKSRKDSKLIGFALRYRAIALDDCLEVKYTKTKVSEILTISRPTLNKNLALLEENNLLPKSLYEEPVNYLTPNNQTILNDMISLFPCNSREHRLAKWFVEKNVTLQKNANVIFNMMQAGLINKKSVKTIINEIYGL